MKPHPFSLVLVLVLAFAGAGRPVMADEKEAPPSPQDLKQAQDEAKKARKEKTEAIKEKMRYFESHVGEWIGTETYEVAGLGQKETSKDEWKGFYSLDGTHFEMHGRSDGQDGVTTYKWICTYDMDQEQYLAWYFDSDGSQDTFTMDWNEEKKTLIWTSEDEDNDRASEFYMKVEGNEITGKGEISRASDGETLINTSLKYKKKRISV